MLRRTITSALAQDVPVEVIVLDDGSTDGTDTMMTAEFPQVRYERSVVPVGPSALRNRGAKLASCEYLFPIDDDAEFTSPGTVRQTLADFNHPRIAAVGIPYVNVRVSPQVHQQPPDRQQTWISSAYVGAAHALRRTPFLAVGGYREYLYYMGEESDVCIRLLARGYVTRLGRGEPMHHHESPLRDSLRADLFARRNDVLFGWHNVPAVDLPLRWVRTVAGAIRHAARRGSVLRMSRGLAWGFASVPKYVARRSPVSRRIYHLQRQLLHRGAIPLAEVEPLLPPI